MDADKRARAFTIEIQIADMKFTTSAFQLRLVVCVDGSGQTILRIVGDSQGVVEIICANDGQHRPEDFLLLDGRARFDIGNHGRFDEETLLAVRASAREDARAEKRAAI